MDRTLEESFGEGDSLFSLPGPSAHPGTLYQTPLTAYSRAHPPYSPTDSIDEEVHLNASGIDQDNTGNTTGGLPENEEEVEGEPEEVYDDDQSGYGSSYMYDPDADPDAFARRLDELAGVLEMGEVELQALRWDPPLGKDHRLVPNMEPEDFKTLINNHITATAWEYSTPSTLFPNRPETLDLLAGMGPVDTTHSIRVMGRMWRERDVLLDTGLNGRERDDGFGPPSPSPSLSPSPSP